MRERENVKKLIIIFTLAVCLPSFSACEKNVFQSPTVTPTSFKDVSALRLNFRFEADVPQPTIVAPPQNIELKNDAIQADFDQNRSPETLEKTLPSPDKNRFLAVYRKPEDAQNQYRLDMYSADGKLIKKITPNGLAVQFPDSIVWSPDNNNVAFVGMIRIGQSAVATPTPTPDAPIPPTAEELAGNANVDANSNANIDANSNANVNANVIPPTAAEQPKAILTLRTEQIYFCSRDGGDLKILTQNEGKIYYYFVWSPDSTMLLALASTNSDWQIGDYEAKRKGEIFTPSGRPRIVEKSGRERLLDDNATKVQPVWSPDSSKVAAAFDKDVRIYDAIGNAPTQAAIPLKNPLLISSKSYDDLKKIEASGGNVNTNTQVEETKTLPDENMLVSFNPIIELKWTEDKLLYLQTAYVREFEKSTDNVRSYARWHRLLLSPQAVAY
jgi:Tol biopolymer transport system component